MGNEQAVRGSQHGVGKQTLTSSAELEMCSNPGKATLTEDMVSSEEVDLARVAQRAGERVVDKGRFEYVVQADGSFEVAKAPVPYTASKGRRITIGQLPSVWGVLHDLLLAQPAATARAPRQGTRSARAPLSPEAMAANDERVRGGKAATVEGSTLDIAKTKADQGNAGTHYRRRDLKQADIKAMLTGDKDANAFYCSGFAMWTLAAAGYDLDTPIVGDDGKPFSYTQIVEDKDPKCDAEQIEARRKKAKGPMGQVAAAGIELGANEYPTTGKITFRKLIDGDPLAIQLMTQIEREAIGPGTWLGVHRSPGMAIFDELIDGQDGTATAAKGLAGAFEAFGIGREVPEAEQKPGDFAQTRTRADAYTGAGHAFQVWSVRARGDAILGEERSPRAVADGAPAGWNEGVEYVIEKDTDPALVGEHTVLAATRIEANVEGMMVPEQKAKAENGKKPPPGDGGVQISGEHPVLSAKQRKDGMVVFYGRLGSSPWK